MDFSISIHPALVVVFMATFLGLRFFHLERRGGLKRNKNRKSRL